MYDALVSRTHEWSPVRDLDRRGDVGARQDRRLLPPPPRRVRKPCQIQRIASSRAVRQTRGVTQAPRPGTALHAPEQPPVCRLGQPPAGRLPGDVPGEDADDCDPFGDHAQEEATAAPVGRRGAPHLGPRPRPALAVPGRSRVRGGERACGLQRRALGVHPRRLRGVLPRAGAQGVHDKPLDSEPAAERLGVLARGGLGGPQGRPAGGHAGLLPRVHLSGVGGGGHPGGGRLTHLARRAVRRRAPQGLRHGPRHHPHHPRLGGLLRLPSVAGLRRGRVHDLPRGAPLLGAHPQAREETRRAAAGLRGLARRGRPRAARQQQAPAGLPLVARGPRRRR
mmetsp:Transcript_19355/g.43898  ORF Transcript_19355/g.43898 Transcript_19355/m.43898 type:complete len:337 (-) Transcript_19355:382-1392(-)